MVKFKRLIALALAIISICVIAPVSSNAYKQAQYYKGYDQILSGKLFSEYESKGFLGINAFKEYYYLDAYRYRCFNYYTDYWISNQGQTVSITKAKEDSVKVSKTVSSEIGAEYQGISGKVSSSMTVETSVTYSTSLGLTYNLKDYSAESVRIAAFGRLAEIFVRQTRKGSTYKMYRSYLFDTSYGYEITLVYR